MRIALPVLDATIEARCRSIADAHPTWPCAKGCAHCCRSLPHLPTVTAAEWERLAPALGEAQKTRIRAAANAPAPVACPLLDPDGACTVYEVRPISCRTYGFYTERDAGLHCALVTEKVNDETREGRPIVWGNGEAIAADMRELGVEKTIAEWLGR